MSKQATSFYDDLDKELGGSMPTLEEIEMDEKRNREEQNKNKEEQNKNKEKEEDKLLSQKDDDRPSFERQKKSSPSNEESNAILRKQRDEALEEAKAAKAFKETFGDNSPDVIKPVFEWIKEYTGGVITPETVKEKLEEIKSVNERLDDLRKQSEEKESIINELDIRQSKEFKTNFEAPYKEALDSLFLEFANLTDDKKIIAPKATESLNALLTSKDDLTAVDIKAAIIKFQKEYKSESGEDPTVSGISAIMESYRKFHSKREKLREAYTNWKKVKTEEEKKKIAEDQVKNEARARADKRKRIDLATKAYKEFDIIEEIDFLEEKEIKSLFDEEFDFGENVLSGKEIPSYDTIIQKGVKAKLFDRLFEKYKDMSIHLSKIEKGERSGFTGSRRHQSTQQSKQKKDWLDG